MRLTKDNGLNGMNPLPKDTQGDSSDEEEEDTRIPKEERNQNQNSNIRVDLKKDQKVMVCLPSRELKLQ